MIFRNIAIAGALAVASLAAQALDLPVKSINGRRYYYYEVHHGDNVLALAKSLGISRDQIIRFNPGAADGLRPGTMLYFPYEDFASGKATLSHEVKRGETLFGLAHRYGVTPDDIIALNPGTDSGIKAGTVVLIPVRTSAVEAEHAAAPNETPLYIPEPQPVVAAPNPEPATENTPAEDPEILLSEYDSEADSVSMRAATIAIVLPFGLNDETPSKQAQLYTDFYRGLLLAADSLDSEAADITLSVFDSAHFDRNDPAICNAAVVIAPENSGLMRSIVESMNSEAEGYVLNIFNLKDESYLNTPAIVQANISHEAMYAKAYQGMRERFGDMRPVLLHNNTGRNEKSAFIDYIRSKYIADGIAPEELAYNGTLRSSDLDRLKASERYVIVPSSGTISEFNKMSHALKAFRADSGTAEIEVFGYPDWTAFRSDARDMLHAIGATIYTRVFFDPDSDKAAALNRAFLRNFGRESMEVVPNQGALGYDVGTMLITNLRENDGRFVPDAGDLVQGLQSPFRFVKVSEDGGYANDALYIVTFLPDKTTETTVL